MVTPGLKMKKRWHKAIAFYSILSTPMEQIEGNEAKGENYLLEVDKPLVLPANRKIRFLMTSDPRCSSFNMT